MIRMVGHDLRRGRRGWLPARGPALPPNAVFSRFRGGAFSLLPVALPKPNPADFLLRRLPCCSSLLWAKISLSTEIVRPARSAVLPCSIRFRFLELSALAARKAEICLRRRWGGFGSIAAAGSIVRGRGCNGGRGEPCVRIRGAEIVAASPGLLAA